MPIFGGFCVCSRALGGRWVRWVNMVAFLPSIPVVEDLRALVGRVDTARHHGVPNGCVLEFNLRSVPPETTGFDPLTVLTGGGRPMALRDAVAAIHRAAEDPRVAGLIARVQLPPSPAGAVQELREAIAAFSAVKPSLAWAETYPGTLSYYLASAFGEVWMQPSGSVGLVGFATNATFLRDALHKAGIEAQFVARANTSRRQTFSPRMASQTPTAKRSRGCWTVCRTRCGRRSPSRAISASMRLMSWLTGLRYCGTTP